MHDENGDARLDVKKISGNKNAKINILPPEIILVPLYTESALLDTGENIPINIEPETVVIDTELTEEGEARGWFISKLKLEDTKGTHVDKGQQFDCKYINYPQTKQAK